MVKCQEGFARHWRLTFSVREGTISALTGPITSNKVPVTVTVTALSSDPVHPAHLLKRDMPRSDLFSIWLELNKNF